MNTVSNQQTVEKPDSTWMDTEPNPWIHYAQICLLDEIPGTVFHVGVVPSWASCSLSLYLAAAKEARVKLSKMWRRWSCSFETPVQSAQSNLED